MCSERNGIFSAGKKARKEECQTLVPWKLSQPLLRAAWDPVIALVAVTVSHCVSAVWADQGRTVE